MKRLRANAEQLQEILDAKPKPLKELLRTCSPSVLKSIKDAAYNVLKANVQISSSQRRVLVRKKVIVRQISTGTPLKVRRQLLQHATPAFIHALLHPVLQLLQHDGDN